MLNYTHISITDGAYPTSIFHHLMTLLYKPTPKLKQQCEPVNVGNKAAAIMT